MDFKLIITNTVGKTFIPATVDGATLTTNRRGSPGTLKFTVIKNDTMEQAGGFLEGSSVNVIVDGKTIFFGFVFTKHRNSTSKGHIIEVTAYDQIRYLKNKDTYTYQNKTASDLVSMLASDYGLKTGSIESCGYTIPYRNEENTTLLDMIENALDLELSNKKEMFVLFDDAGKLCLKNISSMTVNHLIDDVAADDYDYSSSIDEQTYNQVKLTYDNEDTGKREVYIAKDSSHINEWGILQYYDTLKEGEIGSIKADALLSLYNNKTRKLKITKAKGNKDIRAGCLIPVSLNLGDIVANSYFLVEKSVHTFRESEHYMDLTLRGGEVIA